MVSQTLYRGPDETNTATVRSKTQNYHFGVNRLKITDASDAAGQPFFSDMINEQFYFIMVKYSTFTPLKMS
jgi:asparagine synthetase B (glutamine-hydrolysing)